MSAQGTRRLNFLVILIIISLLIACNLTQNTIDLWVEDFLEHLLAPIINPEKECEDQGYSWEIVNWKTKEGMCFDVYGDKVPLLSLEDESPVDESVPIWGGDAPAPLPPEPLPEDEGDAAPALALDEELPGEVTMVGTMTVRLISLDVRTLDTKPEIIAYANIEYTPPPEGVSIQSHGNLWTYNANIALMEKGDWISATCTNPNITSVGVFLGGDTNDGWVRVLVDGQEVWRGSIYGPPESMFINYLEVSGLVPGTHTIKVENLGISGEGGGDDVAMRYFGFSSTPVSGYEP